MTIYKTFANPGGSGPDINMLVVAPPMTDAEMIRFIDEADSERLAGSGCYLTISGFDNDQRDLWDIPEALEFCDRLVAHGMLSLLEFNLPLDKYRPMATGALQLWAWHKRLGGQFMFDRELFDKFIADIKRSNSIVEGRRGVN